MRDSLGEGSEGHRNKGDSWRGAGSALPSPSLDVELRASVTRHCGDSASPFARGRPTGSRGISAYREQSTTTGSTIAWTAGSGADWRARA